MQSAPNYTNAALLMGFVNLIWIFIAIWALIGFPAVLIAGFILNRLISGLARPG